MVFELHPPPAQAAPTRSCAGSASSRDIVPPTECHQGSHDCRGDCLPFRQLLSLTHTHPPSDIRGSQAENSWAPLKHQHCTTAKTTSAKVFNQLLTITEKQITYNNMQNVAHVSAEELQQVLCTHQKRTWLPLYLS